MAYSTGLLRHRVEILNRSEAQQGKFGLDSAGIGWESAGTVWASVDFQRGKSAMVAGSLDVYGVVIIRMRYTPNINERSRVVHDGKTYQILPETFHAARQDNTIQFLAQIIVNER